MNERERSKGKLEGDGRLGTVVWVRYLIAGAALAVARVAFLVWTTHRFAAHAATETEYLLTPWLYPEAVVSILWRSLLGFGGTKYYLAWGSLVTIGSFVLATPILFVRWLRDRHLIVQIGLCALAIPAVTAVLFAIVRLFGLDE